MNSPDEINASHILLTADYMPRPRVDRILDQAARCKLVYVIAGAGYGKTQALHHYIEQQQDAVIRWVQLAESDNVGSRYWESLTHRIAFDNPKLAVKLRELGFPETLARFKQFAGILQSTEHSSKKTFLVLDDFHLIHTKQALTFAQRCANLQIPGACVIILSRKEPEINAVSLFSKGKASMITEDELRFTEDEITDFLRQREVVFSGKDLRRIAGATKGWALAVKLLSLVLKRRPQNLSRALDAMKQNIFKLFETEAFDAFPGNAQKSMVQLSLVSDLPLKPLHGIFDDAPFLQDTPQLASFMWYDSFIADYRIHPLYLEFLQSRHAVLSDQEKQDTYRRAAQWCSENGFYMDAMKYYAASRQYERMLDLFLTYPFKLPYDACEYYLHILMGLDPDHQERDNRSVLLLKNLFIPLLLIGMGQYEEARGRALDTIREWGDAGTPFSLNLLYTAYSNLAYVDMYTCVATHHYVFPAYLKKSVAYYRGSSIPPLEVAGAFAVADIRSFACLVGEGASLPEFDRFIEAVEETALYIAETSHSMYYGYDHLAACELAYYKNQPDLARSHAHSAILKAREKNQYSIEAMTEQYLLRIAVQQGDSALVNEILKQLRSHLDNPSFWSRQLLYDLITGAFYALIGLPAMAPPWLSMDEKESSSEVHIPVRELIVSVRYYIACKKFSQALNVLCKSYPREPEERFLFGELTLSLLTAVARIKTGDTPGALLDFEKAYQLSFHGIFEMFFIELGKNLRPLAAAALEQASCDIPDDWIKMIDRKASAYAKKTDSIMNSINKERNADDSMRLSDREQEVLHDLFQGLSREEIAATRYLSINTVKKTLQSIYTKLGANNNVDAVRIAIERKLVAYY